MQTNKQTNKQSRNKLVDFYNCYKNWPINVEISYQNLTLVITFIGTDINYYWDHKTIIVYQ